MQLARKIRQLIYFVGCMPPCSPPLPSTTCLSYSARVVCIARKCGPLSLSICPLAFGLLWRSTIGEVAVKSFMNFKQGPARIEPRSFLIFPLACWRKGDRPMHRHERTKRQRGREKQRRLACNREKRVSYGLKNGDDKLQWKPLVRLYDE